METKAGDPGAFADFDLSRVDSPAFVVDAAKLRANCQVLADIRDEADLPAKLPVWLKAAPDKLVNKSSATWRKLTNAEKAKAGTHGEKALLAKHPTLIKRPVIEAGSDVHVGWGKDVQSALIG